MRCRECAAKVAVTAQVCPRCGAPIVAQPTVVADTMAADTVVGAVSDTAVSDAAGKAVPASVAGQALPEPYVPGSGDKLPAALRLVLGGYAGIACGWFASALACAAVVSVVFVPSAALVVDPYLDGLLFGLAFWALWSGAGVGACVGAFKGVQALQARGQFSRLLRQPSDPRTATVMASKRGGRTLILDINPGGYQPLSEVRLALWTKAEMLMPGERVTVYGRPGAREPTASQQRPAGPGVPRHGDEPVDRPAPGRLTRR